jgi:hypothetical protein
MKMLGQAHQAFAQADLAYRRDRNAGAFRDHPRTSDGLGRRLREVFRSTTDRRGTLPQPTPTSYTRPVAAQHR